jgi:hypothetical protein
VELVIEKIVHDRWKTGVGLSREALKKLNMQEGAITRFVQGTGVHKSRIWLADKGNRPSRINGAIISDLLANVYRLKIGDKISISRERPSRCS